MNYNEMTINKMSDYELAQRMGTDATDEQADAMRNELTRMGYGDTDSADIPDGDWNLCLERAIY